MVEIYIESLRARHQEECIFICGSGPKKATLVAAPFEHKRLTAKRIGILHYQTVRKPIATEYVWEGMWLEDKQGVWNPHVGKLLGTQRYPKLHLSCSSNQNVNGITPLPSASMFRYAPPICDYVPHSVPITPVKPAWKSGITPLWAPYSAPKHADRMPYDKCTPHTSPEMRAKQLPDMRVVKAARWQSARGLHGFLRPRKVEPPHWFETASVCHVPS